MIDDSTSSSDEFDDIADDFDTLLPFVHRTIPEYSAKLVAHGEICERLNDGLLKAKSTAAIIDSLVEHGKQLKSSQFLGSVESEELYTPTVPTPANTLLFQKKYEGYWILDTIDDWQNATLVYFYLDEIDKLFKARWYHGMQHLIRELTIRDKAPEVSTHEVLNIPTVIDDPENDPATFDTHAVEILPAANGVTDALRMFNILPVLSQDQLFSTFSIQPSDPNTAWAYLWSDWDGTCDNPTVGYVETLQKFVKVSEGYCVPNIQTVSGPYTKNYRSARTLYEYARDYYLYMGQPQKVLPAAWPAGSISNYMTIANNIENLGASYSFLTTDRYRGDGFIGVWKTQYPKKYPITTLHTDIAHHFGPASIVKITGFRGAYSIINGNKQAAAFPPFPLCDQPGEPWVKNGSKEYPFHILLDTSTITVAYDPKDHGVGTITETRLGLTDTSGYRETIAAIIDLLITAFSGQTHTRIRAWRNNKTLAIYETWDNLDLGINGGPKCADVPAEPTAVLTTIRTRNGTSNSYRNYWNPHVTVGSSIAFAPFEMNDPYKLGLAWLSNYENFDIVVENYLNHKLTWNMFYTVTGPIDKVNNPIQNELKKIGYTSNGSIINFTTNAFGKYPPDLVDSFGVHPYMMYGGHGDCETIEQAKYRFPFGIIKSKFTNRQKIGYIRIGSELGMDNPFNTITSRPLAFKDTIPTLNTRADMPWVGSFAAAITKLNEHGVTKIIIDSRNNAGGFAQGAGAIASLFGGTRPSALPSLIAEANSETSIEVNTTNIKTWGNAISGDKRTIDADAVAAIFPQGVFRGANKKLIFLNSTCAGSGGDEIPHMFIGSNIGAGGVSPPLGWDIGAGVTVIHVGNLDGVLKSGVKLYDLPPLNSASDKYVGVLFTSEAGLIFSDRYGTMAVSQPWMAPQKLLAGWFDDVEWPDIGKTLPKAGSPFPLGNLKANPVYEIQSTHRDSWLETSIIS